MNDHYREFLSSISTAQEHPSLNSEDGPSVHGARRGSQLGSLDSNATSSAKTPKARRKSASSSSGIDAVKHRRTRSGCFTCRNRRVKCDETRPICERCRKGNRDCVYPDPPPSKTGAKGKESRTSNGPGTSLSSNDEDDNDETNPRLQTIIDEDETADRAPPSAASDMSSQSFFTPNSYTPAAQGFRDGVMQDDLVSPTTTQPFNSTFNALSQDMIATNPAEGAPNWSHLSNDVQKYLGYFGARITNYHYLIPYDGDNFFTSVLLHYAVRHEPLLNAVVGFAAYHAALQDLNGNLHDFLSYYNKSVTLILTSLKAKEAYTPEVLLTILQLAAIEEYLGDWVNLMGHQKAAFEILVKLFTPQTVMNTALGRACLRWYFRFDNMIALFGGFPTTVSRSWITAMTSFYNTQAISYPHDLRWKLDVRQVQFLQLTYDMALLYAKGSRGQTTADEFQSQHSEIERKLQSWKDSWDPNLTDERFLVKDFPWRRPLDPDDIVDPYAPGVLYNPPLFNTTVLTAEWKAVCIMHKCQTPGITMEELEDEVSSLAYSICQTNEAVQRWPLTPPGTVSALMQCVSLATLFLPQDTRHQTWCRRKFALMEQLGFIHPSSRRVQMADFFGDPSCVRWWLPNGEGFTPVLQALRTLADERNMLAVSHEAESLREVKSLFSRLRQIKSNTKSQQ